MPWWKGGSDFRRFISFILARRHDCLLSWWRTNCSWGDKWKDLNWSPSWWLTPQLSPFSGLESRWLLSFEMLWVIAREVGDLANTSTQLRLDCNWWSRVLAVTASSSSICYGKVKIQNQTTTANYLSKKVEKKMYAPTRWHIPIVPATQEPEATGLIEPRSLGPVWVQDQKKGKKEENVCPQIIDTPRNHFFKYTNIGFQIN
jgi:hypothetical protein